MSTVTNAKDPLQPTPPVRPNYPSLLRLCPQCRIQTPYAYKLPSASSLSSLPSGVRSLFGGQPSRPCSWQAHATQSYSTTGHLFFLSLDCFGVTAWRPEELPHMCAVSVFRSCGGTVNQAHDTSYSASHVLFLECLSSVPLRTSTYLPLTP